MDEQAPHLADIHVAARETDHYHLPPVVAAWHALRARMSGKTRRELVRSWLAHPVVRLCLLFVFIFGIFQGVWQTMRLYGLARQDTHLASNGFAHLQKAKSLLLTLQQNPLDTTTIAQTHDEFALAHTNFVALAGDLPNFPGFLTATPHYGGELQAAHDVLPTVLTFVQIGLTACDALKTVALRLHNPLQATTQGLSLDDLNVLGHDTTMISSLLHRAILQMQQITPGDLQADPRIGAAFGELKKLLPGMQDGLSTLQTLLPVAPLLLGVSTPSSFLVEVLDSTELRPGGGFIGNYGIATVKGATLSDLFITDVDLLDRPFEFAGKTIPYPAKYQWFNLANSWSLRDSNLDADFPTAATYAEQIYHAEGGKVTLQGVVAITPWLIQNAMRITGPITVTEYHETVTADNLTDRIHYHQLKASEGVDYLPAADGHSSQRKRFTSYLFEHFYARVRQILPTTMARFVRLFGDSVHAKDIQLYFNDPTAQSVLTHAQLGATVAAPPTGDSLFIVDANIGAVKANNFITYTAQDRITLAQSGDATHQLTLSWNWPNTPESAANIYAAGSTTYQDYVRIYIPPGSMITSQTGWIAKGTGAAFGRSYVAGLFVLPFGHQGSMMLTWTTPHVTTQQASNQRYDLFVQKQAGLAWRMQTVVNLPVCGTQIAVPAHFALTDHQAQSSQTITQDTKFSFSYRC